MEAAREYAVRAPDAIQMASGLAVQSVIDANDFFFVSSDKEQLSAASRAGMQTLDPGRVLVDASRPEIAQEPHQHASDARIGSGDVGVIAPTPSAASAGRARPAT